MQQTIDRVSKAQLQIAAPLYNLIENDILPGTNIHSDQFWSSFSKTAHELAPVNQTLLEKRKVLQDKIDAYHKEHEVFDRNDYKQFLIDIGYLLPESDELEKVSVTNVDTELTIGSPQLVVPVMNPRYALNAANARWGSLYDALYGTDVIPIAEGLEKGPGYNEKRGEKVIEYAKKFLDEAVPLHDMHSHKNATQYQIIDGQLVIALSSGRETKLLHPEKFAGYVGNPQKPSSVLFQNNNLHVEIQFDPNHPIGEFDIAHVKDVVLEAALTTIQDSEDSIAAVDAEDKVVVYKNWLGLIKGDITTSFSKGNKTVERSLNKDREYTSPKGQALTLSGRSLMFNRNVGHLMTNNAVLLSDGQEIPEGIMDAFVTSLISLHDLRGNGRFKNSREGSIYIVKPKMHGPEEVAFADQLFTRVEKALGLPVNTIKLGLMDEEKRTSVNLSHCIAAAKNRVVFINTGFMDRTGDEIHTCMEAGPVQTKADIKQSAWINAYERRNVQIGLEMGMQGQIGKGMWPAPDKMAEMVATKVQHPQSGATCAWVPSPTAAVLHAMHYHQVDVTKRQQELRAEPKVDSDELLELPLQTESISSETIQNELDNNIQGILGYVSRWVEQGVGCSKVPDLNNVGLMEDRATLRISSQHLGNWLRHGLLTKDQTMESLKRMAIVVDKQNQGDPDYTPMANRWDTSIAFQAACDLVFDAAEQPSGYTEPRLHARRLEFKSRQ